MSKYEASSLVIGHSSFAEERLGDRTADRAVGLIEFFDGPQQTLERELLGLVADLALCVQELSRRLDAAEGRMS